MSNKLSVHSIEVMPETLRKVHVESDDYKTLVQSVAVNGVQLAITVRPHPTVHGKYQLIDGGHRLQAAKDCGQTEILATVQDVKDDRDVALLQITCNQAKINTTPAEYSRFLKAILAMPGTAITMDDLAKKLGVATKWLEERLSLNKIKSGPIRESIDNSEIPIRSAVALAKLPESEQEEYAGQAATMNPEEFAGIVGKRLTELKAAANAGEAPVEKGFEPVPHLRKAAAFNAVLRGEADIEGIAAAIGVTADAVTKFATWAMQLDAASVAEQKAKFDERKALKEKSKAERDAKKATEKAEREAADQKAKLAKLALA